MNMRGTNLVSLCTEAQPSVGRLGWGDCEKKSAFTMGELLIAVVVVGVIAGIVLPSVITHFQDKSLAQAKERLSLTLTDSVNSLVVTKNVEDIRETSLYTEEESPADYNNTSMAFMKEFLKISRACDSTNVTSECFAPSYYEYANNKKNVYTPDYAGYKHACATLKNGMNICMRPMTPTDRQIHVLADLNGRKGPNVKDRDLVEFTIDPFVKTDRGIKLAKIEAPEQIVIDLDNSCDYSDPVMLPTCCSQEFKASCCSLLSYSSHPECNSCSDVNNGPITCCLSNTLYFDANKEKCCNEYGNAEFVDVDGNVIEEQGLLFERCHTTASGSVSVGGSSEPPKCTYTVNLSCSFLTSDQLSSIENNRYHYNCKLSSDDGKPYYLALWYYPRKNIPGASSTSGSTDDLFVHSYSINTTFTNTYDRYETTWLPNSARLEYRLYNPDEGTHSTDPINMKTERYVLYSSGESQSDFIGELTITQMPEGGALVGEPGWRPSYSYTYQDTCKW